MVELMRGAVDHDVNTTVISVMGVTTISIIAFAGGDDSLKTQRRKMYAFVIMYLWLANWIFQLGGWSGAWLQVTCLLVVMVSFIYYLYKNADGDDWGPVIAYMVLIYALGLNALMTMLMSVLSVLIVRSRSHRRVQ